MDNLTRTSSNSTLKAIGVGTILIVMNCYWIVEAEVVPRVVDNVTILSLFPNVVFSLFVLAALNLLLNRFLKKISLNQAELATVYIMLSIATSLFGHDIMQHLVPMIGHAFWFATEENEWANLFHRYIPRWLTVDNKSVLEGYYKGESSFFQTQYVKTWLVPVLAWTSFIVVLLFVMICINVIIRKQWTEYEKLSYPIIRLPLEMSSNTSSLFSNRLMWIGFSFAGGLELLAGLHFLYPIIPSPRVKWYNLAPFFTGKPWNAIDWMPVHFYPFAVGLAYFIPLDLSFSLWFFYLFWKAQLIFFSAIGWEAFHGRYIGEQRAGAWIGIGILALLTSKSHIKHVLLKVIKRKAALDDSGEPMRYRTACFGIIFGMAVIMFFWHQAGLSYWIIPLYFAIYFTLSIAVCRMRAELGPPTHELHFVNPERIIVLTMGTRRLGVSNLTPLSLSYWLTYGYRSHPMPNQLEGFKIAERLRMNNKRLLFAMMLAAIVGTIASFSALISLPYKYGGGYWGEEAFERLQNWLNHPISRDYVAIRQMGFGLIFTVFLMIMRRRFLWWALHPVGYAVGSGWAMSWMWFSVFVSWLSKKMLLKYGGLKIYRSAIPFFLGLILGQFVVGSLWSIIGVVLKKQVYSLFV